MATFKPKQLQTILTIIPMLLLSACDTYRGWQIHSICVQSRYPQVRAAAEESLYRKGYARVTEENRGAADAVLEISGPGLRQVQNVSYADISMRLLGPPHQSQLYWSSVITGLGSSPAEAVHDAISFALDGTHSASLSGALQTVLGVVFGNSVNPDPLPRANRPQTGG